jgi:hypothetical protein
VKTYSAASGYVYQYFYGGRRPTAGGCEPGMEYVFQVSADRRTYSPVAVILPDAALDSWQQEQARELSSSERYAVAKIALFQAFDERPSPAALREPIFVRHEDLARIAEHLGLL